MHMKNQRAEHGQNNFEKEGHVQSIDTFSFQHIPWKYYGQRDTGIGTGLENIKQNEESKDRPHLHAYSPCPPPHPPKDAKVIQWGSNTVFQQWEQLHYLYEKMILPRLTLQEKITWYGL